MPGRLSSLTIDGAKGWAIHPYLARYKVIVHATFKTRILQSVIASRHTEAEASKAYAGSQFEFDFRSLGLVQQDLRRLGFIIGESDEIVELDGDLRASIHRRIPATVSVEDLIFSNAQRSWVNGATYEEAEQAGLNDTVIVDLLYRDYLGRAADPVGLAAYVAQLRQGSCSYADIRSSLIDSDEYRNRNMRVADAPGAVFSQGITMLVAKIENNIIND